MDRYRDQMQDLAAREAENTRVEVEQRHAVLIIAESLGEIAQLLGPLIEEVRGLRQDIAAIKASMPQTAADEPEPTP